MSIKDLIKSKVEHIQKQDALEELIAGLISKIESAPTLEEATKAKNEGILALMEEGKSEDAQEFIKFFALIHKQRGWGGHQNRAQNPQSPIQPVFPTSTPASRPKPQLPAEVKQPARELERPKPSAQATSRPVREVTPITTVPEKPAQTRPVPAIEEAPKKDKIDFESASDDALVAKLREMISYYSLPEFSEQEVWRQNRSFRFTRVLLDHVFGRRLELIWKDFDGMISHIIQKAPFVVSFRTRQFFCEECPPTLLATLADGPNDIAKRILESIGTVNDFETQWEDLGIQDVSNDAAFLAGIFYCMEGDVEHRINRLKRLGVLLESKNSPTQLVDTIEVFVHNLSGDLKPPTASIPPEESSEKPRSRRRSAKHSRLPKEKYHKLDASLDAEGIAAAERVAGGPEERRNTVLADKLSAAEKKDMILPDEENTETVH